MDEGSRNRETDLSHWIQQLGFDPASLEPVSHDASFRRYFRIQGEGGSRIVMDAPPDCENAESFVRIAALLQKSGVTVPTVQAWEQSQGFLLLDDLGSQRYIDKLTEQSADSLYLDALACLHKMQLNVDGRENALPEYDEALLRRELSLFREWFLHQLLDFDSTTLDTLLRPIEDELVESALAQPQVFVHRDYHCRNLMFLNEGNPGVLDFQDAVLGPVTYDLVSLLRDCYVSWPAQRVLNWALYHHASLQNSGITLPSDALFLRWFDLMGMQRHLKAIGIFSRLFIRDGQANYLPDIPRTLFYIRQVCHRHKGFSDFGHYLDQKIVPLLKQARFSR